MTACLGAQYPALLIFSCRKGTSLKDKIFQAGFVAFAVIRDSDFVCKKPAPIPEKRNGHIYENSRNNLLQR